MYNELAKPGESIIGGYKRHLVEIRAETVREAAQRARQRAARPKRERPAAATRQRKSDILPLPQVEGYAVLWNSPGANGNVFIPGAFKRLDGFEDAPLTANHQKDAIIARRVQFWEDEIGLRFHAENFERDAPRQLLAWLKEGRILGASVDCMFDTRLAPTGADGRRKIFSVLEVFDICLAVDEHPACRQTKQHLRFVGLENDYYSWE